MEKKSMPVKTFECPLPEVYQSQEKIEIANKSQLMGKNGLQNLKMSTNS
jgi:hypothetical protein